MYLVKLARSKYLSFYALGKAGRPSGGGLYLSLICMRVHHLIESASSAWCAVSCLARFSFVKSGPWLPAAAVTEEPLSSRAVKGFVSLFVCPAVIFSAESGATTSFFGRQGVPTNHDGDQADRSRPMGCGMPWLGLGGLAWLPRWKQKETAKNGGAVFRWARGVSWAGGGAPRRLLLTRVMPKRSRAVLGTVTYYFSANESWQLVIFACSGSLLPAGCVSCCLACLLGLVFVLGLAFPRRFVSY